MDGQTSQQQPQAQAYEPTCKAPHPNDFVLCGRGDPTIQHVGNAHWRQLIAANIAMYRELPKEQKKLVSASIVKAIRGQDPPGRFLKFDRQTGTWADVGDSKATATTSEALANAANTRPAAGFASGAKTDNESDCHSASNGGGDSTGASSTQTPLASNKMGPKTLAQVKATRPKVDAGVTAGAVTEQQLVWQLIQQEVTKTNPYQPHFSEQQAQNQATMPPPPPRQPQQPQQSIQQMQPPLQQGSVHMQPPLQEQLQSPEQIQNQISQVALMLKQLEVQVQSQGMPITPEQQAQYTFLTQQQQILAQLFSLAQQQAQLASQQQQVMQTTAELKGVTVAVAASSKSEMSRIQNEKPPGSKAQKRLSQEDLARWNRVKVMLAKTTMGATSNTESAHASHSGSSHGQIPNKTMNPAPPPPAGGQHENDAASSSRYQPQTTSLNRDVSMMSAFSGLSGIISIGDAGDFGLVERGDTRGNGTVDMTDMTRDLSVAMSEMSFSRGPSLSAISAIPGGMFGDAQNDAGTGQTRGSLTGLDDDDGHEDQFKSLREGG